MMKKYALIIGWAFFALAPVLEMQAAETIAIVVKTEGSVSLTRSGKDKPEPLERGHRLEDGDKLVTAAKSYAALRFIDDASLVRLGENTICTIQGRKANNQIAKNILVEAGVLLSQVTQQKGKFQVSTPTSVASVKGTQFITQHKPNPGTTYFGEDGEVEVTNQTGSIILKSGFTVYVASQTSAFEMWKTKEGEKPSLGPEEFNIDEFDLEFENDSGQKKSLKFKLQEKK